MDDGAEACVDFVGAQGDALELLEFAEEVLDQAPPSVSLPKGSASTWRIQAVVATRSLSADRRNRSSASAGVFQSSVFRGRELSHAPSSATANADHFDRLAAL